MPAAIVVGTIAASAVSNQIKARGARKAADKQIEAANEGIGQQEEGLQSFLDLLSPYVESGKSAISGMNALSGAGTAEQEQAQIESIRRSPIFQSMLESGENRILANASATGGLRGGNVQQAIGTFAPSLLAQEIENRYGRMQGLAGMGANAALASGQANLNVSDAITELMQNKGSFRAGAKLAQYNALYNTNQDAAKAIFGALGRNYNLGGQT